MSLSDILVNIFDYFRSIGRRPKVTDVLSVGTRVCYYGRFGTVTNIKTFLVGTKTESTYVIQLDAGFVTEVEGSDIAGLSIVHTDENGNVSEAFIRKV